MKLLGLLAMVPMISLLYNFVLSFKRNVSFKTFLLGWLTITVSFISPILFLWGLSQVVGV